LEVIAASKIPVANLAEHQVTFVPFAVWLSPGGTLFGSSGPDIGINGTLTAATSDAGSRSRYTSWMIVTNLSPALRSTQRS